VVETAPGVNRFFEHTMRFVRIVFLVAGLYGLLSLPPLYFLFDYIGREEPPAISHPQFFYGFVGVSLAFQFVFLTIAADPARFRPLILPSVLEKLAYMLPLAMLYSKGRISASVAATAVPDTVLCLLFIAAWFKLGEGRRMLWPPMNVRIP
jgi:hypothetical protein